MAPSFLLTAAVAYCAPVAGLHPNACASRNTRGLNAKSGGRPNHGLFELAHVPDDVAPDFAKLQNGVADHLSRAVVGDVAAAVGVMELHAHLRSASGDASKFSSLPLRPSVITWGCSHSSSTSGAAAGFARGHQSLLQCRRPHRKRISPVNYPA